MQRSEQPERSANSVSSEGSESDASSRGRDEGFGDAASSQSARRRGDVAADRYPVCHERFLTTGPATIELKESKKFHDGDTGHVVFHVDAKTLTLSGRIIIRDAIGANIGYVRGKKTPDRRPAYYFGRSRNEKLGSVRAKAALTRPDQCDAEIYFGDTLVGETTGNWFKKSFVIHFMGDRVAEVSRTMENVEGGFDIKVEIAGVDASLIVSIIMALGEMYGWTDCYNGGVSSRILSKGTSQSSMTTASLSRKQSM